MRLTSERKAEISVYFSVSNAMDMGLELLSEIDALRDENDEIKKLVDQFDDCGYVLIYKKGSNNKNSAEEFLKEFNILSKRVEKLKAAMRDAIRMQFMWTRANDILDAAIAADDDGEVE